MLSRDNFFDVAVQQSFGITITFKNSVRKLNSSCKLTKLEHILYALDSRVLMLFNLNLIHSRLKELVPNPVLQFVILCKWRAG